MIQVLFPSVWNRNMIQQFRSNQLSSSVSLGVVADGVYALLKSGFVASSVCMTQPSSG